jgi:ankyrin repeat protein
MRRLLLAALVALAASTVPALAQLDISPRRPAVITAVLSNDVERVRQSVIQKKDNPNYTDDQGRTALMHAAILGNTEIVEVLLDNGAKIAAVDPTGSTALHWAAARGNADVVRQLVAARAVVNAENKQGATPLMLAAQSNAETVDALLAAGADPKRQDYTGRGAIDYAQAKRQSAIVEKLQKAGGR